MNTTNEEAVPQNEEKDAFTPLPGSEKNSSKGDTSTSTSNPSTERDNEPNAECPACVTETTLFEMMESKFVKVRSDYARSRKKFSLNGPVPDPMPELGDNRSSSAASGSNTRFRGKDRANTLPDYKCPNVATYELGNAIVDLAQNMEMLMASLYNLQTALLNHSGNHEASSFISRVRTTLMPQWEQILLYLQRCQPFGMEVSLVMGIIQNQGDYEVSDLTDVLTSAAGKAKRLSDTSVKLVKQSQNTQEDFLQRKTQFHHNIKSGGYTRPFAHLNRNKFKDQKIRAFVEVNFDAAYPDGLKALTEVERSMCLITDKLSTVSHFWGGIEQHLRKCLEDIGDGQNSITNDEVQAFVVKWKSYEQCIQDAITIVTRTNDALSVEATAILKPSQLTTRGFFRKLLGSSPLFRHNH